MKTTYLTLLAGLLPGTIFTFGSFADFVLMALCSAIGLGTSLYLEGRIDVHNILDRREK